MIPHRCVRRADYQDDRPNGASHRLPTIGHAERKLSECLLGIGSGHATPRADVLKPWCWCCTTFTVPSYLKRFRFVPLIRLPTPYACLQ